VTLVGWLFALALGSEINHTSSCISSYNLDRGCCDAILSQLLPGIRVEVITNTYGR